MLGIDEVPAVHVTRRTEKKSPSTDEFQPPRLSYA